jgi:hypothetical protein
MKNIEIFVCYWRRAIYVTLVNSIRFPVLWQNAASNCKTALFRPKQNTFWGWEVNYRAIYSKIQQRKTQTRKSKLQSPY